MCNDAKEFWNKEHRKKQVIAALYVQLSPDMGEAIEVVEELLYLLRHPRSLKDQTELPELLRLVR